MNLQANATKAAPKRRKKAASLEKRKARSGWFFVLPFILGFIIIYLPIIFDSIRFSFNQIKVTPGGGFTLEYSGWQNYQEALFVDPKFVETLTTGLKQLALDIPAIVIFSLFIAILLNQKMVGRAAFRAIFFIPVILCTGMIAANDGNNILQSYMSNTSAALASGAAGGGANTVTQVVSMTDVTWLFENMKIGTELVKYVVDLMNNIYGIINRSGVQMLVFLSALQSISPAIYESCSIDGATAWETFWKITLPMISPMILVNTVYTVIDSFTSESNTVMAYIDEIYGKGGTGRVVSSAMAWMYFSAVALIIMVVVAILSAYIFYQRRD